jgi:lipoprotein NlpD
VSAAGRPMRAAALGCLALAACAGGHAGPTPGAPLPAWARADAPAGSHAEPEVVRVVHHVEKGQTLFRIARAYGLTPEELAEANGLDVNVALVVGMELFIPGALEPATVPPVGAPLPPVRAAALPSPVWNKAVEPRAGEPLPPELLRAFDQGELPETLARAFDAPTAQPVKRAPPTAVGTSPSAPASPSHAATVAASIGPPPTAEPPPKEAPRAAGRLSPPRSGVSAVGTGLQWPLHGVLYARFGKKGREPHDGIDLAAPAGTPVRTAGEGTVLFAGPQAGYGLVVLVQHQRGLVTVYAHSRDLRVHTGQSVRPGQVIATVGESGKTSGPHLHFEVRVDGEPIDPLRYLGPVPAS